MTKSELIQRIAYKQSQLVERDVELAVKMMLDQMAECLAGVGSREVRPVLQARQEAARARQSLKTAAAPPSAQGRWNSSRGTDTPAVSRPPLPSRAPTRTHDASDACIVRLITKFTYYLTHPEPGCVRE